MARLGRFGLATLLCLLCGCQPVSEAECERMLLRYVDLLAASDRPESSPEERERMREQARSLGRRDPTVRRCSEQVSRQEFECAMKAPTTDLFEQCLM
jgi:hypothetical protein